MNTVAKEPFDVRELFTAYARDMLSEIAFGSKNGIREYLGTMGELVELLPLPEKQKNEPPLSFKKMGTGV